MITVNIYQKENKICAFEISGHAGYAPAGADIVCAAVSSAVQLTANGITEILGLSASVEAEGDTVSLRLQSESLGGRGAAAFLEALKLHLSVLAEDYPTNVKVTCTEV